MLYESLVETKTKVSAMQDMGILKSMGFWELEYYVELWEEIQSKGENGKSMHMDGYNGQCTILGLCEWCPPSCLQNCAVPNLHSHI